LSAGKPVLLNYSGWQRKILEDNKAGFGCDLCNLDEFVEKVLFFRLNRRQLKSMGHNARALAKREFDTIKLTDRLESVLLKIMTESSSKTE